MQSLEITELFDLYFEEYLGWISELEDLKFRQIFIFSG